MTDQLPDDPRGFDRLCNAVSSHKPALATGVAAGLFLIVVYWWAMGGGR